MTFHNEDGNARVIAYLQDKYARVFNEKSAAFSNSDFHCVEMGEDDVWYMSSDESYDLDNVDQLNIIEAKLSKIDDVLKRRDKLIDELKIEFKEVIADGISFEFNTENPSYIGLCSYVNSRLYIDHFDMSETDIGIIKKSLQRKRVAMLNEKKDELIRKFKSNAISKNYMYVTDTRKRNSITKHQAYVYLYRLDDHIRHVELHYYSPADNKVRGQKYDITNSDEMVKFESKLRDLEGEIVNHISHQKITIANLKSRYADVFNDGLTSLVDIPELINGVSLLVGPGYAAPFTSTATYKNQYNLSSLDDVAELKKNLSNLHAQKHLGYKRADKLISDPATAKMIIDALTKFPPGRYEKSKAPLVALKLDYSIVKWETEDGEDLYYAIDKGRKYGNIIGKGGFGVVKRVQNILSHEEAVLKIQLIKPGDEEAKAYVQAELDIVNRLSAKSVVDIEVIDRTNKDGIRQVEFIMPLAKGKGLDEYLRTVKLKDITDDALAIMHAYIPLRNAGVIHCDLKPANLYIDRESGKPHVTVIDFGLSHQLNEEQPELKCSSVTGTAGRIPPEFFDALAPQGTNKYNNNITVSEKTDIYLLGMTLAELFFSRKILLQNVDQYECSPNNLAKSPLTYKQFSTPAGATDIYKKSVELVNWMMHRDPAKRPVTEQVIEKLDEIKKLEEIKQQGNLNIVNDALVNLVDRINLMAAKYKKFGSRHINDFDALMVKINDIMKDEGNPAVKLKSIMEELVLLYEKHKPVSGGHKVFSQGTNVFHEQLNNNPRHHHFIRFIALAMQSVFLNQQLLQIKNIPEVGYVGNLKVALPDILLVRTPASNSYDIGQVSSVKKI